MKKDIDLYYEIAEKPLAGRKHISILIGAGFSAPQGYPIGNTLNENILDFEKYNADFSPSGVMLFNNWRKTCFSRRRCS